MQGILSPDDAALALQYGVDGIILSNHGGRQLDFAPSALEMLPAVARVVQGRVPLLVSAHQHGQLVDQMSLVWLQQLDFAVVKHSLGTTLVPVLVTSAICMRQLAVWGLLSYHAILRARMRSCC